MFLVENSGACRVEVHCAEVFRDFVDQGYVMFDVGTNYR